MKPIKVADGVYCLTVPTPFAVGPVNIFIVVDGNRAMMVDAGPKTEEAWQMLEAGWRELGLNPNRLEAVVLTHHHPDHTGLISYLKNDQPIYGHWRLWPWLTRDVHFAERYRNYFRSLSVRMGVPKEFLNDSPTIDEYLIYGGTGQLHAKLDEGDRIPGFEEWQVFYTPGHAQSHIGLLRDDGVFIGGDVLLETISSNAILEPPYCDTDAVPYTLLQYRDSLKKCLTLPIRKVLPGHGKAYDFQASLIHHKLQEQEKRRDDILQLIKEGRKTTLEIGMSLFKNRWQRQLDLVLSEVQGHLDWLKVEGLVTVEDVRGAWIYKIHEKAGESL